MIKGLFVLLLNGAVTVVFTFATVDGLRLLDAYKAQCPASSETLCE